MFRGGAVLLRGSRTAKLPSLHSKHGAIGYYKGNGGLKPGRHTRKGHYVIDGSKIPRYIVPAGWEDSELQPYVAVSGPADAASGSSTSSSSGSS